MVIAIAMLIAAAEPGLPTRLVNPGFEAGIPRNDLYDSMPMRGWTRRPARGYRAHVAGNPDVGGVRSYAGRQHLFMGYFARNGPDRGSWIGVSQTIDARRWRGRRVRVSVAAYPAHFAAHRAWLTVRAGRANASRRFDEAEQWRRYAVELDVPLEVRTLTVEIGTNGDVHVDDVRMEPAR
jgi:hypothetical protein